MKKFGKTTKITKIARKILGWSSSVLFISLIYGCERSQVNLPTEKSTSTESSPATQTKIVATFLPVYLFTKAVVGDVAKVDVLVKPGTDIHEYQSTPDNVKAIASANILVKNGLRLEEFLEGTVKNAKNPQLVEIDASKGIKIIDEGSPVEEIKGEEHDHKHDHAQGNPHVWLDPVLAKQQVINIRDGLIAADARNKQIYETNAATYIQELDNLNNEFEQTLSKTPNCTFITFHDAFPYMAKRYNLKQVAVVKLPEDKLAPGDIQAVINTVRKYKVKVLFSEPGIDNKLLTSLAQDLNLTLYSLNSLETGERNPQYYFQAMRDNLKSLATGCQK
ncbi:zinc ABC transporter substrate-binding protein [Cylindrospermopsis raciborskii CS-506_D]|uniref:Zinc ABC transporter substrate-binding protein n=2 Tax=Cylindrospermopsis raciborskii TaxID=77022 RepID=A0A838WJ86_9CYAN|nr:zinc ABC transporter substrate-binding protein [Cylindrospermopsis raciborskii]MBA4445720.1 zinc ABC transporter substrate-binding protein [Cylindrospermopsis raciborskii CS-506_C]MBA4449956.1 zinc ABC transporter substrate-binding protein [Cylindrospermopsis raciborskii CS-506_D]MBA4456566.1 zinc ABC transporter substrate-binding protein [Cylindrospermopsis raciborskii CS-506_B]MBA4465924.1 zinc ABC transporter substrate-binding protein [Cylindrospermopsis raciborskii CS-506_A]PNJ93997.1 A